MKNFSTFGNYIGLFWTKIKNNSPYPEIWVVICIICIFFLGKILIDFNRISINDIYIHGESNSEDSALMVINMTIGFEKFINTLDDSIFNTLNNNTKLNISIYEKNYLKKPNFRRQYDMNDYINYIKQNESIINDSMKNYPKHIGNKEYIRYNDLNSFNTFHLIHVLANDGYKKSSLNNVEDVTNNKLVIKSHYSNINTFKHAYNCTLYGSDINEIYNNKNKHVQKKTENRIFNKNHDVLLNKNQNYFETTILNIFCDTVINKKAELFLPDSHLGIEKTRYNLNNIIALSLQRYDISKCLYQIYIKSKTINDIELTINTKSPIKFYNLPNNTKYNFNNVVIPLKQYNVAYNCYEIYTDFPETENLQYIRLFLLTTIITLLLGALVNNFISMVKKYYNIISNYKHKASKKELPMPPYSL